MHGAGLPAELPKLDNTFISFLCSVILLFLYIMYHRIQNTIINNKAYRIKLHNVILHKNNTLKRKR